MKKILKINILGTEYTVEERSLETDEKLAGADGYSDYTSKECIVDEMEKSNEMNLKNIELYKKSVTCSALAFVLFISGIVWTDTIISWAIMPDVNFIKYIGNMLSD